MSGICKLKLGMAVEDELEISGKHGLLMEKMLLPGIL